MFADILAPACIYWPTPVGDYKAWREDPFRVWQEGRCAFCGDRSRLARDHDHETTLVRGLLCYRCNSNEPYEWRNPVWDMYREDCNPAAILGIREPYLDNESMVERIGRRRLEREPSYQRMMAWAML